jgi:hypothetical protein
MKDSLKTAEKKTHFFCLDFGFEDLKCEQVNKRVEDFLLSLV